jgi:phosphate acetyltransferase
MFGALAAGVTLGAKVPVVLSARGESMEVRMASCVLASLVAQSPRASANSAEQKSGTAPAATSIPVAA